MLGPGLRVKGGVSSVEKLILSHLPKTYEVRMIPTTEDGSRLKKAIVFAFAIAKTLVLLLRGWPQVAHIHFASRASSLRKLILAKLCKLFGMKVILHGHGAEYHPFIRSIRPSLRDRILGMLRQADCLICLSMRWRRFFLELGVQERRIVVLPNPVTLPARPPVRENKQEVQFLFLGEIGIRKGAFDIVAAVSRLPEEVKSRFKLHMAGNGMIEEVRKAIENANLCHLIHVRDWVDESTRNKLLAESDVLLLPSYNEGLPMSMLEAMSFGLPVITTPVGGIPEYVRDGESGLLIAPGDVAALSAAIARMASDHELRKRMGEAARESVRPLNVHEYCTKLGAVYDAVISTGAPPGA